MGRRFDETLEHNMNVTAIEGMLPGGGAFASLACVAARGAMAAGYNFKSGTFQGSVFAGCSFAAAPPPWGFEAGRLAEANRRLAEMPGGKVPEPGELPLESWLPHAGIANFAASGWNEVPRPG